MNHKRVERLWRQEGLKVSSRQPKRRRQWLHDGSCVRLRAAHKDHVWSYDFVHERTHDGRTFRLLTVLDEYTRECLAMDVKRRMNHQNVLDQLTELFVDRGVPEYIRSDNGAGVHGSGGPGLAEGRRGEDPVHRARQSLGERICGKF